jgi:hypothetical protein
MDQKKSSEFIGKVETLVGNLQDFPGKKRRAASLKEKRRNLALEAMALILNQSCQRANLPDPPYLKVDVTLPKLLDSNVFSHDEIRKLREIG